MELARALLKTHFGHADFRAGQDRVVAALLSRRDVLCVMPTGAGKSVCYQIPALMLDGLTLVISPLISLMADQVAALSQNGIPAACLHSGLSRIEYLQTLDGLRRGAFRLLYVAPERLLTQDFLDACAYVHIALLAVDEAHCVSQWGQDFRPSYLRIPQFVETLGYRPAIGAFTATATAEVRGDIAASLGLQEPFSITTGFDRPNLRFAVLRPKDKSASLLTLLQERREASGIVYCSTRKTVEQVCARLNGAGFSAAMYHAGLPDEVRQVNQEDFVYDRVRVMVATNAFGMGIDKSNVSYVIHYNMPGDLESYYQEAGRAGRDGSPADCILLYSPADVHTAQFLLHRSAPNPELTEEQLKLVRQQDEERLRQMTFYSTTKDCLRSFILRYFGESAPDYCGNCFNCVSNFEETDITVPAQMILSCILRTGERFGKRMICWILRGSRNERLLALGLDSQSTYGLMKEYPEKNVREMMDLLEYEGYIFSTDGEYPVLRLAAKAREVLFDGAQLMMKTRKSTEPEKTQPEQTRSRRRDAEVDEGLLGELKTLRRALAGERSVPAYVIFSDAALLDMCRRRPRTPAEFLEVSGVGQVKLERYGEAFLETLRRYDRTD